MILCDYFINQKLGEIVFAEWNAFADENMQNKIKKTLRTLLLK